MSQQHHLAMLHPGQPQSIPGYHAQTFSQQHSGPYHHQTHQHPASQHHMYQQHTAGSTPPQYAPQPQRQYYPQQSSLQPHPSCPPQSSMASHHHGHANGSSGGNAGIHHYHQSHQQFMSPSFQKLASANEQTWLHIGSLAETMGDFDRAMVAYESALRHNPYSVPALTQLASLCRTKEQYTKRILNVDGTNGETWGALGHCYLMLDELGKAYNAYQQALHYLPNPQEPRLWYGIGILYDRSGSWENAEEALTKVIKLDPKFEKANEVYFRLGLLYRMLGKYEQSLQCFRYILQFPPRPLTEIDIYFQIGCVYELQGDFNGAKDVFEKVLAENPNHVKVLQQLGWLYQQQSPMHNSDMAAQYLQKAVDSDNNDHRSWFLLGRVNMAQKKYNKAYDCYQQAIYRENRNPMYWCSIGVLYFDILQQRDALDAFTRAIRLNPYIPEVWFNLGALYESCNNQTQDAIDAYSRALEMDPHNQDLHKRIAELRQMAAIGYATNNYTNILRQPIANLTPMKAKEIDPNHPRFNPYNPNIAHHPQMYTQRAAPPHQATQSHMQSNQQVQNQSQMSHAQGLASLASAANGVTGRRTSVTGVKNPSTSPLTTLAKVSTEAPLKITSPKLNQPELKDEKDPGNSPANQAQNQDGKRAADSPEIQESKKAKYNEDKEEESTNSVTEDDASDVE